VSRTKPAFNSALTSSHFELELQIRTLQSFNVPMPFQPNKTSPMSAFELSPVCPPLALVVPLIKLQASDRLLVKLVSSSPPTVMPDYSTLLRSSSQTPSAHPHRSICHRSGGYQSLLSPPKTPTAPRPVVSHHSPDVPRDPEVGYSNGHATATAPSRFLLYNNSNPFSSASSYPAIAPLGVSDKTIVLTTGRPPTTTVAALPF
jgi:hypothetical protein